MITNLSVGLTTIIMLGMLAQWLAWRFRMPSILILLGFGLLAGPVSGLIRPDVLFGDALFPLIKVSVAIILFEGGLALKLKHLPQVGTVIRNLVTLGTVITWVLIAGAAYGILGFDPFLAILLGSILVVTGPTVIGPLIRHLRPTERIASILRWEGNVIDPIGAVLAVLVFETIFSGAFHVAVASTVIGVLWAIFAGGIMGVLGAGLIILMLKRYWIPDFLQSPMSLMVILVVFAGADFLQAESGLLAVTIMGLILANQGFVQLKRIVEFKEDLRVLLLSFLFIILAARLSVSDFKVLDANIFIFLAFLILIVRPVSVVLSTLGSGLKWTEKLFLSWMAPRGVVAAAISSVFAIELISHGHPEAKQLVPVTFFVIAGTVSVYGLTAPWLARILKIATPHPQGVLFIGAHRWARILASALQDEGFRVLMVDTNTANVSAARQDGLPTRVTNVLVHSEAEELDLEGMGRVLALTSNNEVNILATLRFSRVFGESQIYQLPAKRGRLVHAEKEGGSDHLQGRFLFNEKATYAELDTLFRSGAKIIRTTIPKKLNPQDPSFKPGPHMIPLFLVTSSKELIVYTAGFQPIPRPGQILLSIHKEVSS